MHTLIIKAHPRASGFTHRIAESYANKRQQIGNTVEILELTDPENTQSFAIFADESHILEDDSTKRMQEKITQADELVFIFPVWWFDAPAIMKNWMDRNFTSGFAFRYRPNGK
jgi:NAD(P)H dehydrogenase (quinone)